MSSSSLTSQPSSESKVDAEAVAFKYREERDKRLRPDGADQYVEIEVGSALERDPFADEPPDREPLARNIDVLVLGGGFSGLLTASALRQHGIENFLIVDKAADFGGTWYWNRYPGLTCDVESYIYLPKLEELGYIPTRRYAPGKEILGYAKKMGDHFDLYDKAVFQTRTTELSWVEEQDVWSVRTDQGDDLRARFVVLGTGALLHRPKLPGIPGLGSFAGKTFHTSRWDYDYTGGDASGGMTGLRDKRVAVIGTGTSGLGAIPKLAEDAQELVVFQRTPSIVDVRADSDTDEAWFKSLEPGWQKRRRESFDLLLSGVPVENLVADSWSQVWGFPEMPMLADGSGPDMAAFMAAIAENDDVQMDRVRRRVDELVEDPEVAASLKPWFATHCKRPGFHDSYLQTFNRSNVTLVDTQGQGPEKITENAVWFAGKAYEVDCIIFATGFETSASPDRAAGIVIEGQGKRTLAEHWSKEFRSVHGILTSGFPNLFMVGTVRHSALTINNLYIFEEQANHIAATLKNLSERGAKRIEVTPEDEAQWAETMAQHSNYNPEAVSNCTPSWLNSEGSQATGSASPLFATAFGGGPLLYSEFLAEWRNDIPEDHIEASSPSDA